MLAARNITHDPSLDVETGQQTGATRAARQRHRHAHRRAPSETHRVAVPVQPPGQCALPARQHDGARRGRQRRVAHRTGAGRTRDRQRRRANGRARHQRRPRPRAAAVLPRQPRAGEGPRGRRLHPHRGDAARPTRRCVLPGAHRGGDGGERSHRALQPGALPRGARRIPQCVGRSGRRADARAQRHLPGERQAGRRRTKPNRRSVAWWRWASPIASSA